MEASAQLHHSDSAHVFLILVISSEVCSKTVASESGSMNVRQRRCSFSALGTASLGPTALASDS